MLEASPPTLILTDTEVTPPVLIPKGSEAMLSSMTLTGTNHASITLSFKMCEIIEAFKNQVS